MARIFAYLRYSSDNQREGTSLDTQREAIRDYISRTPELNGMTLIEKIDEAKTATTFRNRAGFEEIMREARAGDALVTYRYDRIGRNLRETVDRVYTLEDRGVLVHSASEVGADELMRAVLFGMAAKFSKDLSDRLKRSSDGLARGGYVTNKAPFGYKIESQGTRTGKKLVVIPEQAKIVRRVFRMRAKGLSYRQIAKKLNDEKVPAPRHGPWAMSGIRSMLRNETYLGRTISGMRAIDKKTGKVKKRPRSEWAICENAHKAIINQKIWDKIRQFDAKIPESNTAYRGGRSRYLWTGFLKCPHCKHNLVRHKSKGKVYYGCDQGRRSGINYPCHNRYLIREVELARVVMSALNEKVFTENVISKIIVKVRKKITAVMGSMKHVIAPLEKMQARLQNQVEVAERRLVHIPQDSLPTYLDELNKLKSERDIAQKNIDDAKQSLGEPVDLTNLESEIRNEVATLFDALGSAEVPVAKKRLAQHVERIEVGDGVVKIYLRQDGLLAGTAAARILSLPLDNKETARAAASDSEGGMGIVGIPTGIRTPVFRLRI